MKKITFIIIILAIVVGCKQEEPFLFDEKNSGLNFDFGKQEEANVSMDYIDVLLRDREDTVLSIPVTISGFAVKKDTRFFIRTEANEEYPNHVADVEMADSFIIPADSTGCVISVKVKRPRTIQQKYAIDLVIDADHEGSEIGEGIDELTKFTIYVQELYTYPTAWKNFLDYFGEYSFEKHSFIVATLHTQNFLNWTKPEDKNLTLVEALRVYNRENPNNRYDFAFPLIAANNYSKPSQWDATMDMYYGNFTGANYKFLYDGLNIEMKNEEEFFNENTTTILAERNKALTPASIEIWNALYDSSWWGFDPSTLVSPPRLADVVYIFPKPSCWDKYPQNTTTGDYTGDGSTFGFVIDYYGDYSEQKMAFMMECVSLSKLVWDIFPVTKAMSGSIFSQKLQTGATTDNLKTYNQLFSQKLVEWNAANPGNQKSFTFPVK